MSAVPSKRIPDLSLQDNSLFVYPSASRWHCLSLLPQGSRNPWLLSNLKGPGQVLFSKQNCTGRIQPVQLLNGWQEAPCLEHAVSPLVSNTFGPINILSPRQSKSRRLGNQSRIIFPGTGNPAATTPMDSGTADWQEERDWGWRCGRRRGRMEQVDGEVVSFRHWFSKAYLLFPLCLWKQKELALICTRCLTIGRSSHCAVREKNLPAKHPPCTSVAETMQMPSIRTDGVIYLGQTQ